jgi:hypothetical protein
MSNDAPNGPDLLQQFRDDLTQPICETKRSFDGGGAVIPRVARAIPGIPNAPARLAKAIYVLHDCEVTAGRKWLTDPSFRKCSTWLDPEFEQDVNAARVDAYG